MCLVSIVCRFRLYTVVYIAQSCVPDCSRLVPSTYFSRKREREKERGRGQYSRGPCRSFTRITQRRVEFVNDLATLRSNNLQKSASLKSSHTTKQKNEAFVEPNRPFPKPKNELEKKTFFAFGTVWSGVTVEWCGCACKCDFNVFDTPQWVTWTRRRSAAPVQSGSVLGWS